MAILQRIVRVKQGRPQTVKQHIPYYNEILPSPLVSPQQQSSNVYDLFPAKGKTNPIVLTVHVNKAVLPMELDTETTLSVVSEDKNTYKSIFSDTTYTRETMAILGYIDLQVEYESQVLVFLLTVAKARVQVYLDINGLRKLH